MFYLFVSASIPRTPYTRDQINRMIEDTKGGRYYTQDGKLAVGNEPRMTLEELNRYLQNLDSTGSLCQFIPIEYLICLQITSE